jgi:hypothetical protein
MSRKRTRRKVYQLVNPITHAIAGACITDTAALDKIRLSELTSLEAFRTGHATKHDWRVLADMLNVSETLARDGIGPEAMGANLSAQEALGAVQDRSKQHNGRRVRVRGPATLVDQPQQARRRHPPHGRAHRQRPYQREGLHLMSKGVLPCPTCEMKASCARAGRCLRPLDVEYWIREVREAVQAMNAATIRLNAATSGLKKAQSQSLKP